MDKTRIIIVGGGFGGVACAKELSRRLSNEQVELVLFNRENHLVFSPLLAEVVGSSISPLDVILPLRQLLPRVFCRTEDVQGIDSARQEVEYVAENGQPARMHYDQLVIACGSVTNLNVVSGMADHGFPLKTVADAAALRTHIMERMEQAEVCADPERRRWHLTVLIVGGGYSGVEAAGEINDLLRGSAKYFRNWRAQDVTVSLIHSREQILPEISAPLRDFARRKMEKAGVNMVLNARVASATPDGVGLSSGQFLKGATVVCTIGTSAPELMAGVNAPKEKGRLLTEPDMRVRGSGNVWAVGDCAIITNQQDGQPSPTTGQFAERQGRQCARNIVRALEGQPTQPFTFKLLGELCSIGGHSAVADLFGMHLSGFLAWFVWRGVYLFKLPTIGQRLQVGFDWAWLLLFPRDLAHIRPQQTDRVSHAHYDAGDFIFTKGEAPTHFYVLERGEVEVVRPNDGKPGEIVAVLGAGSFFGERALLGNRPRVMSVRARTPVEVLVMGKNLFSHISEALSPLRDALAQTLNRRSVDVWKERPEVHDLLQRTPLQTLMEPVPQPLLKPTATLREVGRAFVEHANEFFYVTSDGQTLEGVVTITDLVRASTGVANPGLRLADFMTKNPVAVAVEDTCAVASGVIREYRLKNLPVVERKDSRRLIGCLRVRKLMAFVLKEVAPESTTKVE
ncbi:Cyclic nucleotide-regulated FAD-dependent pyridine nucleotide-disulphide oxidoreductase (modular protein) [Verrucomicrobia bacterium]|nr:Cyclic nucleotide-regulated FAD-dependent pyridine nucleotide-disulphide oxidoreductase (modular protein) [Verrucomicrobiota bacterium]